MDKYLGKRLEGRYEIQELIGMGGMANVYKAYDVIDQRTVAVKILRDEFLDNSDFLRRFKNESKAIAVLSHPNVVRVYDVTFQGRVHSIVMEYIDGITLKDYIERQGKVGWKESVHFTLQILRALQHAHDKGIVHRDVKPHNIMLLENGTIKVTDFGIARFARSEVKTITDRAIGSVHYISPEQAMGGNTDEKSDVYSVGVMLFEMLTGQLPFEADSPVSVAIKQIQSQAVRPRSINPEIPEGLEDITMRAMQKDAARRYQSAAEMISDIEKFKQDPSIHFAYKYGGESKAAKDKKYKKAIKQAREEEKLERRRKRTPYIPILTGVTFAFVLASGLFVSMMIYLNNPFKKVEDYVLPDLVGVKVDTAIMQNEQVDLIEEWDNNDEYGQGTIFEMRPRAGTKVKVGSTVTVKVSLGQEVVTLANFAGRDANETISRLTDLGLVPEEVRTYSAEVPAGSVIYTDPSKDAQVASGSTVKVYVSMGPEQTLVNVPNLVGANLDDARNLLELTTLRIGNVTYQENEAPAETIVTQNPPAGDLQFQGTSIDLVVSKGAEGNFKRLVIPVDLPTTIDRVVTLQATMDGELVQEEKLNPSEDPVWNPYFQGEDEIVTIVIFIDGQPYMEYTLDFLSKGRVIENNYSANFS